MTSQKRIATGGGRRLQAPKGTRDLYSDEMLRQRYITTLWRDTAIRHGFEEIEGPMFETSELYAVKSGDGILGELFQAYSGKSPEEVAQVQESGRAPFAMRPEFTPTLARMVAARAAQLPKPTKWFMIGSFFRAERPQRGRLREFLQWNCDVIGDPDDERGAAASEVETVSCMVDLAQSAGLTSDRGIRVGVNSRLFVEAVLQMSSTRGPLGHDELTAAFASLDKVKKQPGESVAELLRLGINLRAFNHAMKYLGDKLKGPFGGLSPAVGGFVAKDATYADQMLAVDEAVERDRENNPLAWHLFDFARASKSIDLSTPASPWLRFDESIVRGLAYYTGTVFELIADGERAIAGGGRYDNLIELLGGPPTPAVGFAMGDVVLGLLMDENGLMPEGRALREALSRPGASLRPDAFVISPDDSKDADVRRLVAGLRRGVESEAWLGRETRKPWDADRYAVRPLHARRSYKSTRNVGKLLKEAASQAARVAVILEGDGSATLKDLDTGGERRGVEPAAVGGVLSGAGVSASV